jgi:hypothetical protein
LRPTFFIGNVYVCDEFERLGGLKPDFITHDNVNTFLTIKIINQIITVAGPLLTKKCNRLGQRLLDVCKSSCMRIAD